METQQPLTSIWPGESGRISIAIRTRARELGIPSSMLSLEEREAILSKLDDDKGGWVAKQ